MELQDMEPWQILVLAALVVAVFLLMVLLMVVTRRGAGDQKQLRVLENDLDEGFRQMEAALAQQSLAQREEQLRTLQMIGDSLAGLINRGTDVQNNILNTWQQSAYEQERSQDTRQARMYQLTEESLGKIDLRMKAVDSTLEARLMQNEGRMERLREQLEKSMGEMRAENAQKLEEMRHTVDEKLQDTLERRLTQSFTQVSERLEQVYQSLGEVHRLADGVGDLKRVLGNVKKRGVWGELQLGRLLAESLTSTQYAQNVQVRPGSDERVEYAVCLPGKEGEKTVYLPIDSKFPQEDFARLAEASDQGDAVKTEAARKALLTAVRVEAKRIAGKYIDPPHTTDFAMMFLPLESLYAEIMRDSEVVEQVQREHRIVIAGPSTLFAMLNSLQMGFRTLAIERRSAEVWRLLGAVKTDFGAFAQVLQKTQEKLRQATDTIDTAFVRTRSIERKLRRVEAIDEEEAQRLLASPAQQDTAADLNAEHP